MPSEILRGVMERIQDDVDGVTATAEGLAAVADARFGEVTIQIDHEEEAGEIRVGIAIPPPAGAGRNFLIWCLSENVLYWDVKIGLDEDGELLLHADLDVTPESDLDALSRDVVDRVESILDLLDDDLVGWLLEHDLGTPAQRERWQTRARDRDDDDDE
jgi:hypothetical protein